MKICTKCKIEKEDGEFHRSSYFKDGRQRYCKTCKKESDSEIYQNRGEEWHQRKRIRQREIANRHSKLILEYLQQHPCVDCGEQDPLVLEFDHVRGQKKYNIGDIVRTYGGWDTIMAEIEKCEVRCANCHRRVTAKRQGMHRYLLLQQIEQE